MTNAKGVLEWMEWKEKREREMTNEEWLRSCNTEQLAEEIYECVMTHPWHISKEVILEWLKQPHNSIKE